MSLDTGKSTPAKAVQDALDGWRSKARRLEPENQRLRSQLNDVNEAARVMEGQLDRVAEALKSETERWGRLASADPTDPVRAGRAAQAAAAWQAFNDHTGGRSDEHR